MTDQHDSRSGEDDLIARYFRPLASSVGALGLLDDAAFLPAGQDDIVTTTDAVVEGVHFLSSDPPETVARKSLRVNLSDLAAKGAAPSGFLLTLALPKRDEDWLARFANALGEDASAYGCPLLGGDTVSTPGPLMLSITAFGRVPKGRMIRRAGAGVGDIIAVTGTIGDSALGLSILQGKLPVNVLPDTVHRDFLISRYRIPEPRSAMAAIVLEYASAAMDISDGLAGDLAKLCAASDVSADIRLSDIPLSDAARRLVEGGFVEEETLVSGGDDYEVLCTVPENRFAGFARAVTSAGVAISSIGIVRPAGQGSPSFIGVDGQPVVLKRLSYSHF